MADFVACDCASADKFTVGILALLAQRERELISERRLGGDMLCYVVTENGQAVDSIDDGTGAVGDPHQKQLSKAEIKRLLSAVEKLPRINQYPWLSSLVIVSLAYHFVRRLTPSLIILSEGAG